MNLASNFPAKLGFLDVVGNCDSHIQIPQGFLHYNLSFPEVFQLGTFLLGTDLCTVPKIYLLLPLYVNRFITKKYLIKTLLKVIDSTSPGLLTLESIIFKSVSIGKNFVMD